ncbi:MAG: HlyD family efflux transporter periplasmic adaptor subunit [Planctomycetota bacterium]|nr:HlyD family efflux transporter periplasmic adaptor subunit [Planctomycetota bacterium]
MSQFRSMRRSASRFRDNAGLKALPLVLTVAAVGGGLWFVGNKAGWFAKEQTAKVEGALVQRGPLRISVIERGNLRAADAVSIKNEIEGNSTILWIIAEGTVVKEGDLLVELDTSQQVDKRLAQEISVRNADAAYVKAQKNYEIQKSQNDSDIKKAEQNLLFAEKDLEKFVAEQGEATNQLAKAQEQITLAEEQYSQAESKVNWSRQLYDKGFLTKTDLDADDLALRRAGIQRESAKRELGLLKSYQLERDRIKLQGGLEEAHRELERVKLQAAAKIVDYEADMRTREAQLKLEQEKLDKLVAQISKAKIRAPKPGMVVYAQLEQNRMGQSQPIQEGTSVRERQEIITIPNAAGMVAQVSLHESVLKQVQVGQGCLVKVDALGQRELRGRVSFVAVLPDQNSWFSNPNTRLYRTEVQILDSNPEMRPGMSCAVEVLVEDIQDTLYAPVQAIFRSGGDQLCFVATAAGTEERKVKTGRFNDKWVQIVEGVSEGETVLLAAPPGFSPVAVQAGASDVSAFPAPAAPTAPTGQGGGAGAGAPAGPGAGAGGASSGAPGAGASGAADPAAGAGSGGRGSRGNMDPAQAEEFRKRMEAMTPEEREKMRERFGRGGSGGAPSGDGSTAPASGGSGTGTGGGK